MSYLRLSMLAITGVLARANIAALAFESLSLPTRSARHHSTRDFVRTASKPVAATTELVSHV